MSVQIIQFRTTPERISEATQQIDALFTAIHDAAPSAMHYTALRDADEPLFTLILELPDGASNPLLSIPAAATFRGWMAGQTQDDVTPRSCLVVGNYSA